MASGYGAVPNPKDTRTGRSYGDLGSGATDFAQGNPVESSPLAQSLGQHSQFHEEPDSSIQGSSTADESGIKRSTSTASTAVHNSLPSRGGTLKKKGSVRRTGSLKRSSSRRSLKAGSIKGLVFDDEGHDASSIFYTPIPTSGSPTEILADRFQAWRQLLKSLIAYFREVQASYETRAKALTKLQNTASNIADPGVFATQHGLGEATKLLDDYHKHSVSEANKSRDIEGDVIGALTGLRGDLAQKIKEIKNLSGDFKNSVDKEKDATSREIDKLQAAIEQSEHDSGSAMGKNDPFVVRLGVDRAVEKQIDEENYLHRAYLNLESSGRELESIVVGEVQKAYKALAGILRREGDDAYGVVEDLRAGPITMPKDQEWSHFVNNDAHFVSPEIPLRRIEDISYPGKNHPAAAEIRAGMLERKSKYLKSYTAGWYVLSPTHLHEFKSADKIYTQPPVMSLYLGEQRLGSHSETGSSSHKFMLKGKQSGGMHKGHNWVFRAESHDTMLAWFNDIKTLTEGSGAERNAFVQRHTRSLSNASDRRKSMSSDGFADDDADAVPYSADAASLAEQYPAETKPFRPLPGGRFPSDMQIPRAAPLSPESDSSGRDLAADPHYIASPVEGYQRTGADPYRLDGVPAGERSFSNATSGTTNNRAVPSSQAFDESTIIAPLPVSGAISSKERTPAPAPNTKDASQAPVKETVIAALPASDATPSHSAIPGPGPTKREAPVKHTEPATKPISKPAPITSSSAAPVSDAAPVPITQEPTVKSTTTEAAPASVPAEAESKSLPQSQLDGSAVPIAATTGVAAGALLTHAAGSDKEESSGPEKQSTVEEPIVPPHDVDTDKVLIPDPVAQPSSATNAAPESEPVTPAATIVPPPEPATTRALQEVPRTSLTAPRTASNEAIRSVPLVTRQESSPGLGGLERTGAHETGKFPTVIRHDTDISISKLHVPGEFR